jgi:hypothetical protein
VRWLLSAVLAAHVSAVIVGPLAVQPSSALEGNLWSVYRPYLEAACLNNGYRFFAPEPGPSHLVRYELTLADGSRIEGVFPDLARHRPRLLYHRHFMLSEKVAVPPGTPIAVEWARAYAEHLKHRYGAAEVKLFLVRHNLPPPEFIAAEHLRLDELAAYDEWAEEWELYPVDRRPAGPPREMLSVPAAPRTGAAPAEASPAEAPPVDALPSESLPAGEPL